MLPVLILILMGMIMTGFTLYAFIQVTNAVREGARAGSLYRITQGTSGLTLDQTVKTAICNTTNNTSALGFLKPAGGCSSASFNVSSDVIATWNDVDADTFYSSGDQVTVQITYRYTIPIISSMVRSFGNPMVIGRTVMMEMQ